MRFSENDVFIYVQIKQFDTIIVTGNPGTRARSGASAPLNNFDFRRCWDDSRGV